MDNNQRQKFKLLPPAMQDFLLSDLDSQLNGEMIKTLGLGDNESGKFIKLMAGLLWKEIDIAKLPEILKKNFSLPDDNVKSLALAIVGRRLLPFDDWFDGQASKFILGSGGKAGDYQLDIDKHRQAIDEVRQQALAEMEENRPDNPPLPSANLELVPSDQKQEVLSAPEVFKKSILNFLVEPSEELNEIADDFNCLLIPLLENNINLKKQLEEAMYENEQILGSKPIKLGDGEVAPTVGHWLKDFIDRKGTDFFDTIAIADYVTNSANASKLPAEDRKVLTRLIELYRNVKFFPKTLEGKPVGEWQIVPIKEVRPGQAVSATPIQADTESDLKNKIAQMTPIELRLYMEENNLTKNDLKNLGVRS